MFALYNGVGGYTGFTTKGLLTNDSFVLGTIATREQAQVLYNQATGELFYDADGTGVNTAAVLFAKLDAASRPALTAANFIIY